ncbi:unnamed protein product [Caenorhabditis sp. 36 PRJEB53466]|nr:unnamed protein product [Caenorhabditis sp. 36 PRJEB53466]
MLLNEWIMRNVGQTLADFVHGAGLDGLVLEVNDAFSLGSDYTDLRPYTFEMVNQIGQTVRKYKLLAILSIAPAIGLKADMRENVSKLYGRKEADGLLASFDYLQLWTYSSGEKNRRYLNSDYFFEQNAEFFKNSSQVMFGLNFYGFEYNLNDFQTKEEPPFKVTTRDRYLSLLKENDSVFTFNYNTMEHELYSERNNTFIRYPSLTSLEYRLRLIREKKMPVAIWDYGQGLDYFTNLL